MFSIMNGCMYFLLIFSNHSQCQTSDNPGINQNPLWWATLLADFELKTYLPLHLERWVTGHFLCSTVNTPPLQPRSAQFLFNVDAYHSWYVLQSIQGTKFLACLPQVFRFTTPSVMSISISISLLSSVHLLQHLLSVSFSPIIIVFFLV